MRRTFSTEIGLVGIWNSSNFSFINDAEGYHKIFGSYKTMIDSINKGWGTFWETGGDGDFIIDLRINPNKSLLEDEEKLIESQTKNNKLLITDGKITIGSPEFIGTAEVKGIEDEYINKIDIESGTYNVDAYFIYDNDGVEGIKTPENDLTAYIVVLRKVSENTVFPEIKEMLSLG